MSQPDGPIVLVTGASSGIGRALSEMLLDHGASVLGVSRRGRLQSLLSPGAGEAVVAGSGDIDVHLVSHDYARKGLGKPRRAAVGVGIQRATVAWLMATLGLGLMTSLQVITRQSHSTWWPKGSGRWIPATAH